jgi:hypothetical protein
MLVGYARCSTDAQDTVYRAVQRAGEPKSTST